ncbi:cytochrome P460 [Sphingomonas sp. MAH-20]|uniref:Cytochrome P460 n=1 Tax=Sphingomonas horti TaxID=2682842 RepID=A0A6I4IXF8_9SPHN|nr:MULTISPECIES: cytochrome P460 family protein [Sphingomonas]MBA2920843.1 cytochrome P460 family protein [Sphingomonas sp. CGMCC 1.13658]MVO76829.1 cytochrome P460 [Sphingomonas horti]
MQRIATSGLVLASLLFGISTVADARRPVSDVSRVYGVKLPQGYRDWKLISVAHEAGRNNDIRAILGNETAVKALREGKRPFPDGAILVRLAWRFESSSRNDSVFPAPQSFVAGEPVNVQVSVKDSKRYAASGGWGYGQFENGVANQDAALTKACFACHARLDALDSKADLVFTHYSQ